MFNGIKTTIKVTKTNNTIQTFWVLLGSLSAFGFTLVSSMLLSRYFSKEDYGTYKQVMYVYNSLIVVFTLGLPRSFSYFLPKVSEGQAKDLINKINKILIGLGAIMSLCLFLGADIFAGFLKNAELAEPIRYFSLVPLFMLPTMGLEGILSTYKKTMFLALYNTLTKVFMLLCVVIPVIWFNGNVNSAIIGFTISSSLCFLSALYFKNLPIRKFKEEQCGVSYRDVLKYTLPLMGASVWGIIISASDQFFISRYFGNKVFADFSNGSLELPFVGMVISASATVLLPVFVKQIHTKGDEAKEEVLSLWRSVLNKTVIIIYPLVIFCFCFADIIMILLYGQQYVTSGIYFQIKIIVNFVTVISYGPLMLAIGGEKYYFKVHMFGAIALILLEWISIKIFNSPYVVIIVSVMCQMGRITAMLLFISSYFKIKFFELFPIKLIFKILIPSAIILFLIRFLVVDTMKINNSLAIIIALLLYVVLYGAWAYYKKIDYLSSIRPLLKKIKK